MLRKDIFLLLLVWLCVPVGAQEQPRTDAPAAADTLLWPANVCERLDELTRDPLFETAQLGLCVYDLTADTLVYAHGARQRLRPASTAKLLTAVTALYRLGDNHRFETSLYYTGEVRDTVLAGDIYIKAGFDPAFGRDDLKAFMHAISALGIRRIEGRIYADRSFKDTLRWGRGWCWDDDEARLTPLLFNGGDRFAEAFFRALDEEHIVADTVLAEKALPAKGVRLAVTRFHTMDQILMRMMKESDNLYAEAMFYQLAAADGQPFAGQKEAAAAVHSLIRKLGLAPASYTIADGSGLSLYNYASAELLMNVLNFAYRNSTVNIHLYPSLPIAGVDGTLERRMRRGCAYDNVRAKTGTLEGVSTLAGYATAANGHVLSFVVMTQGIARQSQGRQFQDRVCEAITHP